MVIWELVNLSDEITLVSEEFDTAVGATMLLGNFSFGLKECGGQKREMPVLRFYKGDAIADWLREIFPEKQFRRLAYNEVVDEFLTSLDLLKMAEVLRTVQVCSPEEREAYHEALKAIDNADKKIQYMNWWKERRRGSLNDITNAAWNIADRLEERFRKE